MNSTAVAIAMQSARSVPLSQSVDDLMIAADITGESARRACFDRAVTALNQLEREIEIVEREGCGEAVYRLGELVGLDRARHFVERWRGDW